MSILITVMIMVNLSLHASNYLNDDIERPFTLRTLENVHLTESIIVDGNQPPKTNPIQEIHCNHIHNYIVRHEVYHYHISQDVNTMKRKGINVSLDKSKRGNTSQRGNTQPKESFFDFLGCANPRSF